MLANGSQGDLVAIIDQSLKTLLPRLDALAVRLKNAGSAEPLTNEDFVQAALELDQVKDQIDTTGEQLEVYYFLYGEKQDDFITFLYGLEEDMDEVLAEVISLSGVIKNDQYSELEQSEVLAQIAVDMETRIESLRLNVDNLISTYESSNILE